MVLFYRKAVCCRVKSPSDALPKLGCTPEEESYISFGGRKRSWKSKRLQYIMFFDCLVLFFI